MQADAVERLTRYIVATVPFRRVESAMATVEHWMQQTLRSRGIHFQHLRR